MISSFRNFAKTKFAGLLVFIMIIPFVFWGMGSMFSSGNTNTIAKINNKSTIMIMIGEKFSIIPLTTHINLKDVNNVMKNPSEVFVKALMSSAILWSGLSISLNVSNTASDFL